MKKWSFIFIIIIFALLQATILNYFRIFNIKPDLLLISAVISALFFEMKFALFLSILSGIFKDVLGVNSLGVNTLLFPLWSFLIIKLSREISLEGNFIRLSCVFIIVFFNDIASRLIFLFFNYPISFGLFLRTTFFESFYTALILPLVLKIIQPLDQP